MTGCRSGRLKTVSCAGEAAQAVGSLKALLPLLLFFAALLGQPQPGRSEETAVQGGKPLFYHGLEYGSESQFNPLSNFINYGLDTLQVRQSFDDRHFGDQLRRTTDDLVNPFRAIDSTGGLGKFINRQVLPIDFKNLDDSVEMIPNYGLHLIGGGMVYRKNVEWLQSRGYQYPRLLAALQGMSAEFLQEVVEKKTTAPDDPVADFYLFRPAGMLLFSWDPFAIFAAEKLRLAEWSYQPLYSVGEKRFVNVGENFLIRPTFLGSDNHTLFLYFGLTNLLGVSHKLGAADSFSWGVGLAVTKVLHNNLSTRTSGGVFYDRNGSLLGSLLVNGTEDLLLRLNIYPGALVESRWFPGIYLGVGDKGEVTVGLSLKDIPLGLSN
jgi:hypothetical protein